MHIAIEASLAETDIQLLYAGLLAADPVTAPRNYVPLAMSLRDEAGKLLGGLMGATLWSWLSIDVLWVAPSVRRHGYGRKLVLQAEDAARTRACTHARLDTFDFQARSFYEGLGYEVYAELPGFPSGHRQLHMAKLLDAAG